MTIGAASRVSLACDGVTKVFPIAIQAYAATDFTVILTAPVSAGGAQTTLTLNSDYSLATSGTLAPPAWTLTTLPAAAYGVGYTLQVFINPVVTQQTNYVQGQPFPSLAVQTNFDRLTQMVQRLVDQYSRTLRAPDGDVAPAMQLASAATRANTAQLYDANGNPAFGVITTTVLTQTLFNAFLASAPLYPLTAAEISASVTPMSFTYPPGNVLRYGADATGGAESTTAFNNAWLCYKTIYAPTGNYLVDTITLPSTFYQRKLYGDGPGRTVLTQKIAANDTLVLGSGGTAEHTIEFADFSMVGLGSSTGSGIRIPVNTPNPAFNFRVKKVTITGYGGRGIYGQGATFNSVFEGVQIDNCNDHQFDLFGGNSLLFLNCYAQRVPTAGKAGYRVHGASPVFISCTGINSGDYWGVFGNTVAEDGILGYCHPTFIGCDMESFAVCGARNKTGSLTSINTTVIVATGTAMGYQVDGTNNPGTIDRYESTFQLAGGAWTNGYPIHQSVTTIFPFISIGKWVGTPVITYWNDADAAAHDMSGDMQGSISSGVFAKMTQHLYVQGMLRATFSGRTTFAAATTAAVTFITAQPDPNYGVAFGQSANKTFWYTSKTTAGFTLNASSSSSDTVDWFVFRPG